MKVYVHLRSVHVIDWMVVSLPNSYVEILTRYCDGIRRWELWEVIKS